VGGASWPEPLDAEVFRTPRGTPYLRQAGVVLLARPEVRLEGMAGFLDGFGAELGFAAYLQDPRLPMPGAQLCKVAGQVCYLSLGPRRTPNAAAQEYLGRLIESGHGSVLEHATYTVLLYGVSRSLTHELVRHRAGMAYSQASQRYLGGATLRFVERPEFQHDAELHALFEARIDRAAEDYRALAERLDAARAEGSGAAASTERRKRVQQAARALLPNETEAPIVVTGNARAWRHVIAARCDEHAEPEIRRAMGRVHALLVACDPFLFGDFRAERLADGTVALRTAHPKV
jgi:thymidylate synthase (FAD)